MNRFYNRRMFFVLSLYVSISIPLLAEYAHITFTTHFTQSRDKDFKTNSSHHDFSHDKTYDHPDTFSTHKPHFNSYTVHDFRDHFIAQGYTESEILNQRCLYMLDEFVKYAQTYSSYKQTIEKIHKSLQNLTFWQKAYYAVKGTYCRKLQKRIANLYKSLDVIKKEPLIEGYYNAVDIEEKTFHPSVAECFAEYKILESVYKSHTPNLAKIIGARSVIYRNSTDSGFGFRLTNKSYNLNSNIKQLLSRSNHDINTFARCYGNQLQQAIHQESLDISIMWIICLLVPLYMIIKRRLLI